MSTVAEIAEIAEIAAKLNRTDQAELVVRLLENLDPSIHYVSDEDALRRRDELVNGDVEGLSEEDFWKACGRS